MRTILAAFYCVIALTAAEAQPADVATIEAIDDAAGELDEAFVMQDAEAIKALVTPDHVAVTYYYEEPQSVAEQIASLPELKYEQQNLSEPTVAMLGEDAALRTFTASLSGTFKGKPLTARVFVTAIMVKRDGKWLEHFYQVTKLPSGGDDKPGCKDVAGTYLTKNSAEEGGFTSRSLLSLGRGGVASLTDSGEGGEAGFAPFTDGRGAWSCVTGDHGEIVMTVTTLDFTSPPGGVSAQIGRLDFDLGYDPGVGTIAGTASLYFIPLEADPLASDAVKDGRQFQIAGKRVEVP
jgi:hypothetical protein